MVKAGTLRPLHPALKAHGAKVKAIHAHLSAHAPGFRQMPMAQQMKSVQAHIRKGR